ncbi:MAG: hypothetical protein II899_11485 [Bacteroidales bacterium]|nr:hypothetical protein [Bacteroidales bacterium]
MKTKNYKKSERKTQAVEEPSVAYNSGGLDSSTSVMTPDGAIPADADTMTVDEFIGKIRKALDLRYENIQC